MEIDANSKLQMNIYQRYKYALSNTIKSELKFRDNELMKIEKFISSHLKSRKSSSIYLSGPPGTGKTASVNYVLEKLEKKSKFNKLWFNGMSFKSPINFYKKLFIDLSQKEPTSKDLKEEIAKMLSRPRKPMTILIFDEIDILHDLHPDVSNMIFSLPKHKSAKVLIIGIANRLDFTIKLSRYHSLTINAMEEIVFNPYDSKMISGILKSRISHLIEEYQLFQNNAIELCAMKVASLHGDIRKALEIMRRSVELIEQEISSKSNPLKEQNQLVVNQKDVQQNKIVTVEHILKILNQVFADKIVEASAEDYTFPIQQKLALCAIVLVSKENVKNVNLGKCYERFRKIAKENVLEKIEINSTNLFLDMCEILETKSFISIQKSKDIRCTKIFLSIGIKEAEDLLKSHTLCRSILF